MTSRLTIFQWGYEGWGNATKVLVRSVDSVERDRGYEPPIFVDVRYSRSVRAIGFRDQAFERLLGHARYRWMRSLGNKAIKTGGKMKIQCPDAAQQLLDLAMDAAKANRRVIFFCSCPSPHGAEYCHRSKVAKLLLRAARGRGVRVQIEEWPGGAADRSARRSIRVSEQEMKRLLRGSPAVMLTPAQAKGLADLAHGSIVELTTRSARQLVSVHPPMLRAARWHLPLFILPSEEGDTNAFLTPYVRRFRRRYNLDALRS